MSSFVIEQRVFLVVLLVTLLLVSPILFRVLRPASDKEVTMEVLQEGNGPPVTTDYRYSSMVTLYIEHANHTKTPAGWSTRKADGADRDEPFDFQPGVNLIEGWTEGVLRMKEGERAWLHVPAAKGYGDRPMGKPGGDFYIPANSDLLFDLEILGKTEDTPQG